MRKHRVFFLAILGTAAAVAAACGLDLTGEQPIPVRDAGSDARPPVVLPEAGPDYDAGPLDPDAAALARCIEVCGDAGGACDAGVCTFDCGDASACQGATVACPPGLPCTVACGGTSSCDKAVDCSQATACNIACTGTNSCQGGVVRCSGSTCALACTGTDSCNTGVACDAGSCNISCAGDDACRGGAGVRCESSGSCAIGCDGGDACNKGASCDAGTCLVDCTGPGACRGDPVTCRAATSCSIACGSDAGTGSCDKVAVCAAPDCKLACFGAGNCPDGMFCDGGNCGLTCGAGASVKFCCKAPTSCSVTSTSSCSSNQTGCP